MCHYYICLTKLPIEFLITGAAAVISPTSTIYTVFVIVFDIFARMINENIILNIKHLFLVYFIIFFSIFFYCYYSYTFLIIIIIIIIHFLYIVKHIEWNLEWTGLLYVLHFAHYQYIILWNNPHPYKCVCRCMCCA